jgi:integrase
MTKRLTAVSVRNAKPIPGQRREIPDPGCPGLYLIIQPSGAKSWAVRYRHAGKPRKLTIGPWPKVTLEHARKDATAALLQVKQDADPAAAKMQARTDARTAADAQARDTVANLAAQYVEKHVRVKTRPTSQEQTEGILRRVVLPAWQGRTVHQIQRRDIIELLESVAFGNPPRPILANRVLAVVRKFFNWLASRDVIVASPCVGVDRPGEERARDRYLDDTEVAQVWRACDGLGYPYGSFIQLLLLTGQRRTEVAGMRWSEINGTLWELPAARTKNARAHTVPLSAQAQAIIAAAPRIVGSEYVLSSLVLNGYGRVKAAVDVRLHLAQPWVFHDLRRTVASGMQRIGVQVPVIEQILNHRSGTFRGIVGVYQKHAYDAEKAAALQRWADHIDRVTAGEQPDNVQQLRRR